MATELRMERVSKSFPGVVALREATFRAQAGEVHALMGANGAGKSTLMNILGGVILPSAGEISVDGAVLQLRSPRDAAANGIAFVQQELNMLPAMTVGENICIGNLPGPSWRVDTTAIGRLCQPILDRMGCRFAVDEPVELLSTGDRQMVEIARAVLAAPRILIFDEPTSSLTERERRRLFDTIGRLRQSGTVIIYITHFIEEIFAICDRVTVMRNGTTVSTGPIGEFTPAAVARLMLGEAGGEDGAQATPTPAAAHASGQVVLEVRDFGRENALSGIGFDVRAGEVVGIWGLLGSGRTELLRALTGLDPIDTGTLRLRKRPEAPLAPVLPKQLHDSVGFVTEDRRGEGLLLPLSVEQNLAFPNLGRLMRFGFLLDRRRAAALSADLIGKLSIKVASARQAVATLSGGNQQKVVIGRWLATSPVMLFFDEPTRGVDVGAKAEILRLVAEIARSGVPVVIVSSEIEEIQRVSDRILVMNRGCITGELRRGASRDDLMEALSWQPQETEGAALAHA